MGCIICNLFEIWGRNPSYEKCKKCVDVENTGRNEKLVVELAEELCNDIAVNHPEMVARIMEIVQEKIAHKLRELVEK
jgi:hypothetical protein